MENKRLEIYVGWKCNQRCIYCKEFPNMERIWDKKVTISEILKLLIKYNKFGYNHVSYLGGEPFIQPVFYDALKLGKKFGYTILVTTNCTTLHIESQAQKFLPYIDELILSMEAIDLDRQELISRTKNYVRWDEVFNNVKKYWNGKMLKVNIVITKINLYILFEMVEKCYENDIKDIAITYPDIDLNYYGKEFILGKIAPKYSECIDIILLITKFCKDRGIKLKLPDFPFCVFPRDDLLEYIKLTDDYDYQTRINIFQNKIKIDRGDLGDGYEKPRQREHVIKCNKCIQINKCWGPSRYYNLLYGLEEINFIK